MYVYSNNGVCRFAVVHSQKQAGNLLVFPAVCTWSSTCFICLFSAFSNFNVNCFSLNQSVTQSTRSIARPCSTDRPPLPPPCPLLPIPFLLYFYPSLFGLLFSKSSYLTFLVNVYIKDYNGGERRFKNFKRRPYVLPIFFLSLSAR